MAIMRNKEDTITRHSTHQQQHVQVRTILLNLPSTTNAKAKDMFQVTDDGKLRVRGPLHKQFKASQVKALDCVIAVNGNASDPQALLHACVTDVPVELKLQRDLES